MIPGEGLCPVDHSQVSAMAFWLCLPFSQGRVCGPVPREPFSGGDVTAGLTVQRILCPSLAAMGEQVVMVTVDTLPWNLHEARWALAWSTSAVQLSSVSSPETWG